MGSVSYGLLHYLRISETESANFDSLMCSLLPKDLHSGRTLKPRLCLFENVFFFFV